jgi:lycopene cyclase domain-containing protein
MHASAERPLRGWNRLYTGCIHDHRYLYYCTWKPFMFGQFTYLLWLLFFIGLPLLLLLRWRRALWKQRRALGWATAGALGGGWIWDALAVRFDLWYYDPANIAGLWFLGLPLEEWLWIVGVTLLFGGITVVLAEQYETGKG